MNTVARIANRIASNACITRIANSNAVNTTVKGDTTMNALNTTKINTMVRMARRGLALMAFAGLLGSAHAACADVVVDRFTGPQDAYNNADTSIIPGQTVLQVKVRNTSATPANNIVLKSDVYLAADAYKSWTLRATITKTISLAGNQYKWINLVIPDKSFQGKSLHGQYLYATVLVQGQTTMLKNFLNAAYRMDLQKTDSVTNPDGTVTVSVKFTNTCHITSPKMTVTFNYTPYADGDLGAKVPMSNTLMQLGAGQSTVVKFTTRSLKYYSYAYIDSDVAIGTDLTIGYFQL